MIVVAEFTPHPSSLPSGRVLGGWSFNPPPAAKPAPAERPAKGKVRGPDACRPQVRRPQVKNDPRLVAAARELRDRWLEKVNAPAVSTMPVLAEGKYDVRRLAAEATRETRALPLFAAA